MSIIESFGVDSIPDGAAGWKDSRCVKKDDGQKHGYDAEMPFHVQYIIDPKQKTINQMRTDADSRTDLKCLSV
jgi:hypothetical protein